MVFLKYDATTVTEYTEPKPKPKPKPKPRTRAKASTAGGKRNHTSRTGAVSRSDRLRYFQQGLILLEEKEEDLPSNLAPTKTETDMTPNTTKPLPYVPKRSISLEAIILCHQPRGLGSVQSRCRVVLRYFHRLPL